MRPVGVNKDLSGFSEPYKIHIFMQRARQNPSVDFRSEGRCCDRGRQLDWLRASARTVFTQSAILLTKFERGTELE